MQLIWTCTSFVAKDTTLSFTGLLSLLLLVQAAPSDRQSSYSPLLLPRRYETCWPAFLFPPPAEWTSSSAGEAGRPTDLPGGSPAGWGAWLEAGKARQGKAQGAASLPGSSHAHELHPSTSSTASPNTLQHYQPLFQITLVLNKQQLCLLP